MTPSIREVSIKRSISLDSRAEFSLCPSKVTNTFNLEVITDLPACVHHADEQLTHPADVRVVIQHQELVGLIA